MQRDFKGVWIPKEIWLSEDLTLQEKVFLAEISSLDNEKGCFASNKYFADFFKLTPGRCSQIISSLEKKHFINIKLIFGDKSNVEKRIIRVVNKLSTPSKYPKGGSKYPKDPYLENAQDNNTCINNTNNIYTIFEYWNEKGIMKHKEITKKAKDYTESILQNYSLDELKKAVDNYKQILDSDKYFWTHKWTYESFMKPGNIDRFTDKAKPKVKYMKNKQSSGPEQAYDSRDKEIELQQWIADGNNPADFNWTD